KEGERVGSAVLNRKSGSACPAQADLARHDGIDLTGRGTCAGKSIAPVADRIRNRDLVQMRIVGNQQIREWLPSHIRRREQFRRACGTSGGESSAVGGKEDGGCGLVQAAKEVDLCSDVAGGVDIGNGGCAGDGIDGDPLRRVGEPKNLVRLTIENFAPATGDRKSTRLNSSHLVIS